MPRAKRLSAVERAMRPGNTFGDVFDAHAPCAGGARPDGVTGSTPAAIQSARASRPPGWTCQMVPFRQRRADRARHDVVCRT